jgi:hypothetical protein
LSVAKHQFAGTNEFTGVDNETQLLDCGRCFKVEPCGNALYSAIKYVFMISQIGLAVK